MQISDIPVIGWIPRYAKWLHLRWPAGTVERLPEVHEDGTTAVAGVRVVGDLTGIPLLKFAVDSGAKAVQAICAESDFSKGREGALDVAIIGAGVAGISAAVEAKKQGLKFEVYEATANFSTVVNFPKGKPIYTYPTDFTPAGEFHVSAPVKEELVEEMEGQRKGAGIEPLHRRVERVARKGDGLEVVFSEGDPVRAQRVIIAIGRSGNFRKLGCPGEDLEKVYNRLFDPKEFYGKNVLVVGGGDSALEAAIALATCGSHVTLSYRKKEFSRPKPENLDKINALVKDPAAHVGVQRPVSERVTTAAGYEMRGDKAPGSLQLRLGTTVKEVRPDAVTLSGSEEETLPNDVVFAMIGRDAPLEFFRRSGIPIRGEWRATTWLSFIAFFLFCIALYHWKSNPGEWKLGTWFQNHHWFPYNLGPLFASFGNAVKEKTNLLYTLASSMSKPSFYYTLAYCACVLGFGIQRIRRRKTPYIKVQTWTLIAFQCLPLFILPEILLPWMGRNGWFTEGAVLKPVADQLFESYDAIYDPNTYEVTGYVGEDRAYWRAYGFILAFPLFVYNVFTDHPLWGWLIISFLQTFVLIPLLIWRWGKGAYCGWICSCGALAETLGDTQRSKMPHGPVWNRVNLLGQIILAAAFVLLLLRILGWSFPAAPFLSWTNAAFKGGLPFLNYSWFVDLFLAGIVGVGLYFWFSGRVWCRFACPLAALMHIYARFSKFRIFPEKSKCISCNVCTSVCHQGIDIMNFANKGAPMEDPECVRCSACVQSCPTGVLAFGRYGNDDKIILDQLQASPVRKQEEKKAEATPE